MAQGDPSGDPPPETEVKDFYFKLLCQVKIADELKNPDCVQLLTVATKYGLVFIGTDTGVTVIRTPDLEQFGSEQHDSSNTKEIREDYPTWASLPMPAPPTHLMVNTDQTILAVATTHNQCAFMMLYDIGNFSNKGAAVQPFMQFPLSSDPTDKLSGFAWNPALPTLFAYCLSGGRLSFVNVKEANVNIIGSIGGKEIKFKCVCWSPKGKQLVAGDCAGSLRQYNQEMKLAKHTVTPLTTSKVLDIFWHSTSTFFVAFQTGSLDDEQQPDVYIVQTKKDQPPTLMNFEDVCFGNGLERAPKYYFQHIPTWDVVMSTSANALEVAVFGRNDQNHALWERWSQEDAGRAELPLNEDYNNTLPVGIGIDYTTQREIVINEALSVPAMPILYLLSTEGVLLMYHVVNLQPGAVPLNHPVAALPAVTYPSKGVPSGASAQQQSSAQVEATQPKPFSFGGAAPTAASAKPPPPPYQAPAQPTSNPPSSLFGGGSTPLSKPFSFAPQPVAQTGSEKPSLFAQPFAPTTQKPLFGQTASASPLSTAGNIPKSTPSIFGQVPTAPIQQATTQPQTPQTGSATVSKPPTQPQQLSKPATTVVQQVVAQPQPSTSGAAVVGKPAAKTGVTGGKPAAQAATGKAKESTPANNSVDSEFTKNILEEIEHFNKELNQSRQRANSCMFSVGKKEELVNLTSGILDISQFCEDVKESTQDINQDIHKLKSQVLHLFALEEEARVQKQRLAEPRLQHLQQARALDPASSQTLQTVHHLSQYIESSLQEVNAKLDSDWKQHNQKRDRRMQTPVSDTLYRSLTNNHNVITSQTYRMNKLIAEMKQLKLYNETAVWQNRDLSSSFTRSRSQMSDEDLLTSLADSLVEHTSTSPVKQHRPSVSPEKQARLRQFFGERGVVPVRCTPPGKLSSSRLIETSKFEEPVYEDISDPEDIYTDSAQTQKTMTNKSGIPKVTNNALGGAGARKGTQVEIKFASGDHGPSTVQPRKPVFAMAPVGVTSSAPGFGAQVTTPPVLSTLTSKNMFLPSKEAPVHRQFETVTVPASVTQAKGASIVVQTVRTVVPSDSSSGSMLADLLTEKTLEANSKTNVTSKPTSASRSLFTASSPAAAVAAPFSFSQPSSTSSPGFQFGKAAGGSDKPSIFGKSDAAPVKLSSTTSSSASETSSTTAPQFSLTTSKASVQPGSTPSLSIFGKPSGATDSSAAFSFTKPAQPSKPAEPSDELAAKPLFGSTQSDGKGFSFSSSSSGSSFGFGQPTSDASSKADVKSVFGQQPVAAQVESTSTASGAVASAAPSIFGQSSSATSKAASGFMFGQTSSSEPVSVQVSNDEKENDVKTEQTLTSNSASPFFDKPASSAKTTISQPEASAEPSATLVGQSSSKPPFGQSALTATTTTTTSSQPTTATSTFSFSKSSSTSIFGGPTNIVGQPSTEVKAATSGPSGIFGQPSTDTKTVSGSSTSTTSIFGQSSGGSGFSFTKPSTSGGSSIFGKSESSGTETSSSELSSLLSEAPAIATKPLFGQTTTTTSTPLFGQTTTTGNSFFGQTNTSATTANSGEAATTGTPSIFGQPTASASKSLFGASPTPAATDASPKPPTSGSSGFSFGGSSASGSTPLFGQTTTSGSSTIFGQKPATGTAPLFGQTTSSSSTPLFGQNSSTPAPLFGSQTAVTSAPLFGQPSSGAPSMFGQSSSSETPTLFGGQQTSGGSTTLFGQPATSGSSGLFGQQAPSSGSTGGFGQSTSQPLFGSSTSTPSGGLFGSGGAGSSEGGGLFGGLGGKPSAEKANQNPFGVTSTATPDSKSNLFGNAPSQPLFGQSLSSPTSGSSAFGGGGSVISQGFGGFGSGQSSGGFGGAPAFGGAPKFGSPSGGFGGTPTFGSSTAFGAAPSFGSPTNAFQSGGSVFGGGGGGGMFGSTGDSSGFGSGSQAPSFGALAHTSPTFGGVSQGDTPAFGGGFGGGGAGTGFGQQQQTGQSPSFTSYRS